MVSFRPFKGILPHARLANQVVTRPFDSYSKEEVAATLQESPYSFLHVIVPVAEEMKRRQLSPEERLKLGKKEFEHLLNEGALEHCAEASYFIYKQTGPNGESYTGIMGAASVNDYENGRVKKHEETLEYKEILLKDYLDVIDIHAEPVYLTIPDHPALTDMLFRLSSGEPALKVNLHHKTHEIWPVFDKQHIKQIQDIFAGIDAMYIADGHHRCASSALFGEERKSKNPSHTGTEAYNGFLAVVIPESGARLYEFSRLVRDLGEHSPESFLNALGEKFEILPVHAHELTPKAVHEFGLYLDKKAYRLKLKNRPEVNNPLDNLDPQLLNRLIFEPILHISDLRKDKRVKFIGGKADIQLLEKEVDSGKFSAAFLSYPVPFEQFKQIADAGLVMPPKSTWFEPKFPSALVIYPLGELNQSEPR